jgi:hypothetical protein
MDLIVLATAAFALTFFMAWLNSPRLREWIERPKYEFQANLRSFDEARRNEGGKA